MKSLKLAMYVIIGILSFLSNSAIAELYKTSKPDSSINYADLPDNYSGSTIKRVESLINPIKIYSTNPITQDINDPLKNIVQNKIENHNRYPKLNTFNVSAKSNHDINIKQVKIADKFYTFQLSSPSEERAYRKPAQAIEVNVINITPALQKGDEVIIAIDGKEVARGETTSIPTAGLNPGEHILTIQILSKLSLKSNVESMKLYIIQNTN